MSVPTRAAVRFAFSGPQPSEEKQLLWSRIPTNGMALPTKLGKYEFLSELGHGAMGVVYRARDPIINRFVAIKTLTASLSEDLHLRERF